MQVSWPVRGMCVKRRVCGSGLPASSCCAVAFFLLVRHAVVMHVGCDAFYARSVRRRGKAQNIGKTLCVCMYAEKTIIDSYTFGIICTKLFVMHL